MNSETFKKVRLRNNLTQAELANFLACSKSSVEKIEAGGEIKGRYILEVMTSIKKWGIKETPEECLSALEQFKFDASLSINNLIDLIDMTEDDIKKQQELAQFDYLQELKNYARQAASDLKTAVEIL